MSLLESKKTTKYFVEIYNEFKELMLIIETNYQPEDVEEFIDEIMPDLGNPEVFYIHYASVH